MDPASTLAFALAASLLVASPGPNGVLIARTVPSSGREAGFANVAGFCAAFFLHGTLSIFGISLLLTQSAQAFAVVKLLGAAYLCWLGIKALVSAWRNTPAATPATAVAVTRSRSLGRSFTDGLLTNALNPKVSMFYLAAFPQFLPAGADSAVAAYALVTIHALVNVAWFSAMVVLFDRLAARAKGERFQRWLKGVTGVVFLGFGARLATLEAR